MFVDKEIFNLCMYLDKIYENEGVGADVFEKYLDHDERFSVVREFTMEPHVRLSSMVKVPEFLSYVWILEKIKKQLERLFSFDWLFCTEFATYDELCDDYGISEILTLFSKDETRKNLKDPSRYSDLIETYAKLENAVDRLETTNGIAFVSSEHRLLISDFLAGKYLVLSTQKHDIATIRTNLVFREKEISVENKSVRIIATSSTIKQAKEWVI